MSEEREDNTEHSGNPWAKTSRGPQEWETLSGGDSAGDPYPES